ncbi:Yip1 domain [Geoglobus ahangari]|uniref:Yip1 domain n=1 Tax=Geoglobus ahangari TaxID=113653 RepID=A0A0F7IIV4_9EURY|nr:YIP1 family protein [Geoglobus ahangari]AKG92107.1 Yip1 domain [Geoglobus ahangari]
MKLVANPNAFFEELKQKDIRIRIPLLTIAIPLAILISAYQYLLVTKLSQAFPEDLAKFFVVGAYVGIIGSFIGIFAVWLILATIMHGLSAFFGGEGSFRRTFEFVGYGFLPSLIGSAITISMSAYYISKAETPKISLAQLQQNPDVVKAVVVSLLPESLVYSNLIINAAVTVWSLAIWSLAVKHARGVGFSKAFICALIPTALFGVYQVWNILKLL